MTDKDIIKDLEDLIYKVNLDEEFCLDGKGTTELIFFLDALKSFINRQKAEIERLKESRNRWRQLAEDFDRISREEEVGDEQ